MARRLSQFFLQNSRVPIPGSVTSLLRTNLSLLPRVWRGVWYSTVRDPDNEYLLIQPETRSKIIDGTRMARRVREEVAKEVGRMVDGGKRPPQLTAVLVGSDPASHTYVSNKTKAAKKCGINTHTILRDSSISQEELLELIDSLNSDDQVDGILVQLPLPCHIDTKMVCNAVSPEKDVDGFHVLNIGRYCLGNPLFIPATPLGVLEILRRCNIPTFGKNVCVVNRTKHIGFALAALLHSDGTGDATTTICHVNTPSDQLPVMTRTADIIIVGTGLKAWESSYLRTGVTGLIRGDMVKDGAVVIDIGISRLADSRLVGDVAFEEVSQVASLLTPVPKGVGPMTVAMLMRNTLSAAQKNYQFDFSSIRDGAS